MRSANIYDRAGQLVTQERWDRLEGEASRLRNARVSRILRLPDVADRVALGKTQIYALMAAGNFPSCIKLSERAIGWLEHEIEAYVEALTKARATPSRETPQPPPEPPAITPQEMAQFTTDCARLEHRVRGTGPRIERERSRLYVLPLDQLRGLGLVTNAPGSGIYFLWRRCRLVYIGRSRNVAARIFQHSYEKTFTHATWLKVADECHEDYESAYVAHYRPPLNRTLYG